MHKLTAIVASVSVAATASVASVLLASSPAGATAPLLKIGPHDITVAVGSKPGIYLEIPYSLNSENVAPVAVTKKHVIVTVFDVPGGYIVLSY
jgi:hypothetical protein